MKYDVRDAGNCSAFRVEGLGDDEADRHEIDESQSVGAANKIK